MGELFVEMSCQSGWIYGYGRRDLFVVELVPVDFAEEAVLFDLLDVAGFVAGAGAEAAAGVFEEEFVD